MGVSRTATAVMTWAFDMPVELTRIYPITFEFEIDEPTKLTATGHAVIKHRKNYPGGIGWGLLLGVRGPFPNVADMRDSAGLPTWYGIVSGNLEHEEHYKAIPITGAKQLTLPGVYRAELWGNLHGSSAYPDVPILPTDSFASFLIESSGPQNQITYRLEPGEFEPNWL